MAYLSNIRRYLLQQGKKQKNDEEYEKPKIRKLRRSPSPRFIRAAPGQVWHFLGN